MQGNASCEHTVDERDEEISELKNRLEAITGDYLDAAHDQADLQTRVDDLESQLASFQDARTRAHQARDEAMPMLLRDVVALGEPESERARQAIAHAAAFMHESSNGHDKAATAFATLYCIVREHATAVREFGLAMTAWMTKDVNKIEEKVRIVLKYPKALCQLREVDRECWSSARCHSGTLSTLRDQMTVQTDLATQAAESALVALRRGSSADVILGCVKTAYLAYAVMQDTNFEAGRIACDLADDLRRTTDGLEAVLAANKKSAATVFEWSSWNDRNDMDNTQGPAGVPDNAQPFVADYAADYVAEETQHWTDASGMFDTTYEYHHHSDDMWLTNPANGLPMIPGGGCAGVDVMGNPYGFDDF